jgi:hypothetical protein
LETFILSGNMNSISALTPTQLRQAADIQERILSLQEELNSLFGGGDTPTPVATEAPEQPKKRGMSAAGRARIGAAARARWAKLRAEKGEVEVVRKPKRKMSAQGLANIRAGVAKRWGKKNVTTSATVSTTPAEKPKRKMTAAWKKSLALAREARWAKAKKAGK